MTIWPLAFIAALAAQAPAQGPDWQTMGTSPSGAEGAYDRNSIVRDGQLVRITIRLSRPGSYGLTTIEIQCTDNSARALLTRGFQEDGTLIGQDDVPSESVAIPPESYVADLKQEYCPPAG